MATSRTSKKKKKASSKKPKEFDTQYDHYSAPVDIDLEEIEAMIESIDDSTEFCKILIHGPQGTGKTTIAGTHPERTIFIDCNERGTKSVRGLTKEGMKFPARSWDDIEGIFWYLATKKHPYKHVVIDTTTNGADLAMAKVLEMDGHEGLPIKKHWGQSTQLQKKMWLAFRNLPMDVTFLCQTKTKDEEDLEEDETVTKVPAISPSVSALLEAAVDMIGFTFIKESISTDKKGREKKDYKFCLRIGPSSTIRTKARVPKGTTYPHVLVNPEYKDLRSILLNEEDD